MKRAIRSSWAGSCALLAALALSTQATVARQSQIATVFDTEQADAVLDFLERRARGVALTQGAWQQVFSSEGYRRLMEREHAMGREFNDSLFRAFVESDTLLARLDELRRTLIEWKHIDVDGAAARALAYLPQGTTLRATVYLTIKPATNSFVYDLRGDPAIFMYVDPAFTAAKLENTVAHELHHVGLVAACPDGGAPDESGLDQARRWTGAFGEGLAMLAAAGGPAHHPHASSDGSDRERWDGDVANFAEDLATVEEFLVALIANELSGEEALQRARSFYGIQGPWYTVGWKMGAIVERALGRQALIDITCHPEGLPALYNRAAAQLTASSGEPLPRWSEALIEALN